MKFRRFLSGLLFGLGCALSFIGILALVLPAIPNPQLKLVLSSFAMQSDSWAVNLINRFMSFALQQNWRMLCLGVLMAAVGAWLLVHFTPKRSKSQPVSRPQPTEPLAPAPEPVVNQDVDETNPFAIGTYNDHIPQSPPSSTASFVMHSEPILERNRIEEAEVVPEAPPADAQPYVSSRFAVESRAIEAEVGSPSQSGSRILIRSAFESPALEEEPPAPPPEPSAEPAAAEPAPKSPSLVVPAPMAPLSPRIRSTMGRHGTIRRNLPTSHS